MKKEKEKAYWVVHAPILKKRELKTKAEKEKAEDKMKVVEACAKIMNHNILTDGVTHPMRHHLYDYACKAVIKHYQGKVNDHVAFPVIQALMYKVEPTATVAAFGRRMQDKFKYLYEV